MNRITLLIIVIIGPYFVLPGFAQTYYEYYPASQVEIQMDSVDAEGAISRIEDSAKIHNRYPEFVERKSCRRLAVKIIIKGEPPRTSLETLVCAHNDAHQRLLEMKKISESAVTQSHSGNGASDEDQIYFARKLAVETHPADLSYVDLGFRTAAEIAENKRKAEAIVRGAAQFRYLVDPSFRQAVNRSNQ